VGVSTALEFLDDTSRLLYDRIILDLTMMDSTTGDSETREMRHRSLQYGRYGLKLCPLGGGPVAGYQGNTVSLLRSAQKSLEMGGYSVDSS
jgi:hypothetical protein